MNNGDPSRIFLDVFPLERIDERRFLVYAKNKFIVMIIPELEWVSPVVRCRIEVDTVSCTGKLISTTLISTVTPAYAKKLEQFFDRQITYNSNPVMFEQAFSDSGVAYRIAIAPSGIGFQLTRDQLLYAITLLHKYTADSIVRRIASAQSATKLADVIGALGDGSGLVVAGAMETLPKAVMKWRDDVICLPPYWSSPDAYIAPGADDGAEMYTGLTFRVPVVLRFSKALLALLRSAKIDLSMVGVISDYYYPAVPITGGLCAEDIVSCTDWAGGLIVPCAAWSPAEVAVFANVGCGYLPKRYEPSLLATLSQNSVLVIYSPQNLTSADIVQIVQGVKEKLAKVIFVGNPWRGSDVAYVERSPWTILYSNSYNTNVFSVRSLKKQRKDTWQHAILSCVQMNMDILPPVQAIAIANRFRVHYDYTTGYDPGDGPGAYAMYCQVLAGSKTYPSRMALGCTYNDGVIMCAKSGGSCVFQKPPVINNIRKGCMPVTVVPSDTTVHVYATNLCSIPTHVFVTAVSVIRSQTQLVFHVCPP